MKLFEAVSINKNFQSSVNLDYDLYNEEKIQEYIPTSDVCSVLKLYISSILYGKNRATSLVGPYGKGKSFLMLVLTYLISGKFESQTYQNLILKIKKIDLDLYTMLKEVETKEIKLLPVIINSNLIDTNQAFLLALRDSLERFSIRELIPKTTYDVCSELLDKWINDSKVNDLILLCCEKINVDINDLKKELKVYSLEAYKNFEKLYNCVTIGLELNPLISSDTVKVYTDINNLLKEKKYTGMFIIFDEFSKYIESKSDSLTKGLKLIQDFAEKANRSGTTDLQLHLCCITHKSIKLYGNLNNDSNLNSFKTVEGRFKDVRFNRSIEQNYEIIGGAIRKKSSFINFFSNYYKNNKEFYNDILQLELFSNGNFYEVLFKECFPLNPLTVYSLVNLSEIIAQNERTLFTFISDNDENSLNTFITNNNQGLFDVSKVYDYFLSIMKRDESEAIRSVLYRCETSIKKTSNILQKKILKVIAIIEMINDYINFNPSFNFIRLSLMEKTHLIEKELNNLIANKIIKKNFLTNYYSFSSINSKEIDIKISSILSNKLKIFSLNEYLDELNTDKYIIPRRFNHNFKMTRFYKVLFITEEELQSYNSFKLFNEGFYSDGIIFYLLRKSQNMDNHISKFLEISESNMILKYPRKVIENDFFEAIKQYVALSYLNKSNELSENEKVEVNIIISELSSDLSEVMNNAFSDNNCFFINKLYKDELDYRNLLSKVFEEEYEFTPIINNELLNKKNLSSQYQKSRNNVIDIILNNGEMDKYSETSPERTIFNSLVLKRNEEGINRVIDLISSFIKKSENIKLPFEEIFNTLTNKPYGIRTGVIPVMLAMSISEFSENILLYNQTKEIEVNSDSLSKLITSPSRYYISLEKGFRNQSEYLKKLNILFGGKPTDSFRENLSASTHLIRKWYMSLPGIFLEQTQEKNVLNLGEDFLLLKLEFSKFNINNYNVIFKRIPTIYQTKSLDSVYNNLENMKKSLQVLLDEYKVNLIEEVIGIFDKNYTGSLINCIKQWKDSLLFPLDSMILEYKEKKITDVLLNDLSFNDKESLNKISSVVTGSFIEDWNNKSEDVFINTLVEFKSLVEDKSQNCTNNTLKNDLISSIANYKSIEISTFGEMLQNGIEELLSEYGESISAKEKISILLDIVNKVA